MRTITIIYPGEFTASYTVQTDLTDLQLLEEAFGQWNHGSGCESDTFLDAHVRSMSVNDIVKISNPVRIEGKYYQCESVGWKEVTRDFVANLEAAVQSHPDFKIHGGWFALDDVMRLYRKGTLSLC